MRFFVLVFTCVLQPLVTNAIEIENAGTNRDTRKLFGGYKITPRFCKPTRRLEEKGPTICMFNHECVQRNGEIVGACMDGFLFGACCQLPDDMIGELMESEAATPVKIVNNNLHGTYLKTSTVSPTLAPLDGLITSSGVSQITNALLNGMLPTAQDNAVVQVDSDQYFTTTGVTHPTAPDTILIHHNNAINSDDFRLPTTKFTPENRKTTSIDQTTPSYKPELPIIQISISSPQYTQAPIYNKKPVFVPKPIKPNDNDKYVLVPTITHETKPNKTQEFDSIVNIIQMLNESTTIKHDTTDITTKKPPSTSYVFSLSSTHRPSYKPETRATTKKSPSTSYTYYTKKPSTATTYSKPTYITKRPSTTTTQNKKGSSKPVITKKPSTSSIQYISSSTFRPIKTTYANSPDAFTITQKPPTTSYVYSSSITKRPTTTAYISGPSYSVSTTSPPLKVTPTSPPPTVIVLGPFASETSTHTPRPASARPSSTTSIPIRKPVTQVTINNHITQNIYSSERPSPTVLITPKPSISSIKPIDDTDIIEQATSPYDAVNFPPVRHPNLNMSLAAFEEDESTPSFVEDEALDKKVESLVNKIIQGLQEPFNGLKDLVYDNKTSATQTTTKKPIRKASTTKRPTTKPNIQTTSGRPISTGRPTPGRPAAGKPTAARPSSGRPPSGRPSTPKPSNTKKTTTKRSTTAATATTSSQTPTKKPTTPYKKTKPTKKVTTTPVINEEENYPTSGTVTNDYRSECGRRPLVKSPRIVGGKGAVFGEFPWQVLVRESTWLGLFTKNKCGGVLISNRYVLTAAHCQPGFLASLVAVFGEFDISGDLESKRPLTRNVKRVIVHRKYDAATFENDLALLELEHAVQFDTHILPICLPRVGEDFTGRIATVTGWGRLKYGGGVPSVLQEVQVPIMENHVCQEMFRTAGHNKLILESFLCAGYANGQKDSCEGDSGGPLVLQRPDGRYQLAGTVSHGIKCAAPYLPGVYMRTAYYKPWIESITGVH